MNYLPVSNLIIHPERQRQYFDPDKLAELQASIEANGLLQPLVVRNGNELVCGERRFKAIQSIYLMDGEFTFAGKPVPDNSVPVIDLGELSQAAAMEAELDENIKRQDLTWQEHAEAIRKLSDLRTIQRPETSIADLAEEITGRRDGAFQDNVRKKLIVSQHLNRPEIAKAKTVDEAFKILKREERSQENIRRGQQTDLIPVQDRHLVLKGDCINWLESYTGPGFNCIITDPPYGMNADSFSDAGGKAVQTHEYKDDRDSFIRLIKLFAPLSFRVTAPEAHLFVWCDLDNYHFLRFEFMEAGWHVHRTPIIYHKPDGNRVPWPGIGLQRKYEVVLFAEKGGKPLNNITGDVFSATGDTNLGHGAQKPVAAYAELLKRACRPNDRVLDPFAGSGTLLPAAHVAQCNATLIEQSDEYYGIICKRLEELK